MQVSSSFKRLWWMIAATTVMIAMVVYLGVVPVVKSHHLSLGAIEERLSQGFLPSGTVREQSVSGGMSRGGSFSRPSAPAPSAPRSLPSYGGGYGGSYGGGYGGSYGGGSYGYRSAPGPVIVPYPTYAPAPVYVGTGGGGGGGFLIVIVVVGFILLPIAFNYLQGGTSRFDSPATAGSQSELLNNIVTVTRLQIVLLAGARDLQRDLDRIALNADLTTPTGLAAQLRETVLALLRHPDYWTHVRAESQTVAGREQAAERFERLSIQERSKFTVETLVNVGGEVQRRAMSVGPSGDVASHIVVTLLLGTADDRPLFSTVNSVADLRAVLQRLGSISPAYLLVYELLWTPQDPTDSLSGDELLANYPDLVTL
ncbi:DUF1517 domain-containing protein [Nodosilinea sp. FACHB-13]|uniref:DUF1517 domain-containing protein n=1 Tax=Cyanophyceae TaxID=3028117 RepID=UPI00168992B3|nr:DUF1517 domain-containing protein [Nodosilinea sp. FACHB-13]MBD2107907.1 DUF1517 domain-containing protein [Nodosilinea sp. FACHB-13]